MDQNVKDAKNMEYFAIYSNLVHTFKYWSLIFKILIQMLAKNKTEVLNGNSA